MSPRKVDREKKSEQIMRAALAEFVESGAEAAKMADIAVRARVGKGTLYEYFPSKQDLYIASLEFIMDEVDKSIASELFLVTEPVDQLTAFIRGSFKFFVGNREMAIIMADLWCTGMARKGEKPLLKSLQPKYRELQNWIASIINTGIEQGVFKQVDAFHVASAVLGMIDGLMFQGVVGVMPEDEETFIASIGDLILKGIMP